jgi:hypothetical protein
MRTPLSSYVRKVLQTLRPLPVRLLIIFSPALLHAGTDTIGKRNFPATSVSGQVTAITEFYQSDDSIKRYAPISWTLSGNLLMKTGGWDIPVFFLLSEKDKSNRQAFNKMGIGLQKKWLKLFAGNSNVYFSDFTMAGVTSLGGGVELTPGKFRFGAVYGRLQRKVAADTTDASGVQPVFERWGGAIRVGYGNSRNFFDLIFLQAKDKISSLSENERGSILPAENEAAGFNTRLQLLKNLTFDANGALSIFTRNVLDSGVHEGLSDVPFSTNKSTQGLSTFKTSFCYSVKKWSMAAAYKRIEPGYRSMGTYYFQDDVEQILLSPAYNFIKKRISLNASLGWEHNNLFDIRTSTARRFIGNFRGNWQVNDKYGVDLQYANFGMTEKKVDPAADTAALAQKQSSVTCIQRYFSIKNDKTHLLLATLLYQHMNFKNGASGEQQSHFASANLNYSIVWLSQGLTLNSTLGYSDTKAAAAHLGTLNLLLGIQKSLLEGKMLAGVSENYQPMYSSGSPNGAFIMTNATLRYTLAEKHTFSLDGSYQHSNNNSPLNLAATADELRAIVSYQFIF